MSDPRPTSLMSLAAAHRTGIAAGAGGGAMTPPVLVSIQPRDTMESRRELLAWGKLQEFERRDGLIDPRRRIHPVLGLVGWVREEDIPEAEELFGSVTTI